jgi:hypothetical protein
MCHAYCNPAQTCLMKLAFSKDYQVLCRVLKHEICLFVDPPS